MKSGSTDHLVDTNILVYSCDPGDSFKHARAVDLLSRLQLRGTGAVSTQVLGEFFCTVTREIVPPMTAAQAEFNVDAFLRAWTVFPLLRPSCLRRHRGCSGILCRTGTRAFGPLPRSMGSRTS